MGADKPSEQIECSQIGLWNLTKSQIGLRIHLKGFRLVFGST